MQRILIIFFLLTSSVAICQPNVADKVTVDGKNYYEHIVEPGNTLWGLQKMYGVSTEQIMTSNPVLSNGLKVGQKILIPTNEVGSPKEIQTIEYKVKKKETLYGLSKKFNLSVDELITLNPELANGLQKGQVIKVPGSQEKVEEVIEEIEVEVPTTNNPFVVDTIVRTDDVQEEVVISFSDSTVKHVVLAHETMYSISKRFMISISELMKINGLKSTSVKEGQVLIIPVKNEKIERVEIKDVPAEYDPEGDDSLSFEKKEMYNIAIMLPLHLDYGDNYSKYVSNLATQFYMGAKLAIDSLEELGLNAKIHVFDTKNDSLIIAQLFEKEVFSEMDLIIGPLMKKEIYQVAEFCKENKIRMVCPVSSDAKVLEGNRLIYSSVASNITLMKGLATYLNSMSSSDNIILVKPKDEKSIPYYDAFREAYKSIVTSSSPPLVETTIENFNSHIRRKAKSRFVVPSTDKTTAMKFMNNLNRSSFRSNPGGLFVYGMKEWVKFTDINNIYKNRYNFHYPSSNHLDYYEDKVVDVNKWYRSAYKTDLPKMAVQGYDVLFHFCSEFFLEEFNPTLLMNEFDMKQISPSDGYENSNVFIIEQEEFELVRAVR